MTRRIITLLYGGGSGYYSLLFRAVPSPGIQIHELPSVEQTLRGEREILIVFPLIAAPYWFATPVAPAVIQGVPFMQLQLHDDDTAAEMFRLSSRLFTGMQGITRNYDYSVFFQPAVNTCTFSKYYDNVFLPGNYTINTHNRVENISNILTGSATRYVKSSKNTTNDR